MKYVNLNDTGLINPGPHLAQLPTIADALPPGARTFATNPTHYDFSSARCVKDLKFEAVSFAENGTDLMLRLHHNCWKHDEDLTIHYHQVTNLTTSLTPNTPLRSLNLILDELLPHPVGLTHELGFRSGTLHVTAHDLSPTWTPAACLQQPTTPP